MWNGRIDLIDQTVHADFTAHVPGREPFGREQLRQVITALRAHFDVFSVKPELGPIREADLVSGRWTAVAVSAGEASHWVGHSIFRIADGRIHDHWEINSQLSGRPFDIAGSGDRPGHPARLSLEWRP